jgi:hypothetical protein
VAGAAAAQQPERSTFYLIVGNDTLTVERAERSATSLRVDLFDRKSRSRVEIASRLAPAGLIESSMLSITSTRWIPRPQFARSSASSGIRSASSAGATPAGFASALAHYRA